MVKIIGKMVNNICFDLAAELEKIFRVKWK